VPNVPELFFRTSFIFGRLVLMLVATLCALAAFTSAHLKLLVKIRY
jgi:hypothetical protein